ncbi:MAG TPA: hypothetical protein VGF57_06175 [Roseiarcus sp.]
MAPLHACFVQSTMFTSGFGMIILTRKTGPRRLAMAGFLVDVYCLGVKDVLFRDADEATVDALRDAFERGAPFEAADPCYARKLLHDAVAYARSLGLEPHADYAAVEPLFGDVDADASEAQFKFGYEGKPLYVPGPSESSAQIRRRLDRLRRHLGDDGFVVGEIDDALDALDGPDDEGDDVDFEGAYDPAVAPDPAHWLALGEEECLDLVMDYHRRAGISLPRETMHSTIHVIIENQIALGDELPVRRTVERLMTEGLDRHEAVHAVGSLLTDKLFEAMKGPEAAAVSQEACNSAIEQLTAENWRRDFGIEENEE